VYRVTPESGPEHFPYPSKVQLLSDLLYGLAIYNIHEITAANQQLHENENSRD
jgi:hypothetical protein